jgi:hypothetical protein
VRFSQKTTTVSTVIYLQTKNPRQRKSSTEHRNRNLQWEVIAMVKRRRYRIEARVIVGIYPMVQQKGKKVKRAILVRTLKLM